MCICLLLQTSFDIIITISSISVAIFIAIILCIQEVCGWINEKASIPVWAKMTPNITDITFPARTALNAGCEGVAAINTIQSVMGVNLKTLRPEPSVEGYSTPGGYSSVAVKPIALAKVNFCIRCTACIHASAMQAKASSLAQCVITGNSAQQGLLTALCEAPLGHEGTFHSNFALQGKKSLCYSSYIVL